MTHDELLKIINKEIFDWTFKARLTPYSWKALRAVVELHKPISYPDNPDSPVWCNQCAEERGFAKYPCPTIQAIEKELK